MLGFGLDAHILVGEGRLGGGAPDDEEPAAWVEATMGRPGDEGFSRVVALRPDGSWDGIETVMPDLSDGTLFGSAKAPLRSRLDPNGVVYLSFSNFDANGVVAVRPHPLPPPWLEVEVWQGTLGVGERREVALSFRPGAREVGEYGAVLQVFEAETGEAVEVPLVLEVVPGVDAEGEASSEQASSLAVYPNPSSVSVTVAFTLDAASEVRVTAYDVLGRAVAVLHEGPLSAGEHALAFEASALPAGVYVVRATGDGFKASRSVTLVR